jgi:tRNA threonylcarbamoyladenosine biosynthesis protein TsaE
MLRLHTSSPEQQEMVGAALAAACPEGAIIYLHGNLGAGKTTLVRGFIHSLGHSGAVKSPTYTLMEPYQIGQASFCHIDLYRLADAGELEYLGLRDLMQEGATLLVEWPERGEGELPQPDLLIHIEHEPQGRNLQLSAKTERGKLLLNGVTAQFAANLNN